MSDLVVQTSRKVLSAEQGSVENRRERYGERYGEQYREQYGEQDSAEPRASAELIEGGGADLPRWRSSFRPHRSTFGFSFDRPLQAAAALRPSSRFPVVPTIAL